MNGRGREIEKEGVGRRRGKKRRKGKKQKKERGKAGKGTERSLGLPSQPA